jgi:hypothetical protein
LNIPDFDLSNFTGTDANTFASGMSAFTVPSAQDLAEVNFTPTYIPVSQTQQYQQQQNLY